MTDMVQGDVPSSNASSSIPADSSSSSAQYTPATQPAPAQSTQNAERTFRQQEVNDIVGRAKAEAVERYRRESSMSAHQAPQQAQQPSYIPQNMSPDEVKRLAAEETQRLRNEWVQEAQRNAQQQDAQRIANDFFQKIESGKDKYQDFDSVMSDVEFGTVANTVALATNFDNTADIMYELARNPLKMDSLEQLIARNPKLAMAEMKRLSTSIKNNEQANQHQSPNAPLSQMRPTKAGAEKSGPLTVGDYRRKYKV